MPRSVVHVLLSLLLLLAQQAALLHVAMDWGGARGAATANANANAAAGTADAAFRKLPGKLPAGAAHDACALCMDSAQLAFALPLPALVFAPLQLAFGTPAGACDAGIHLAGDCVVQPRGPPQA